MKDQENRKYIKLGITGVAVVVVSLLCFFLLFRLKDVFAEIQVVVGILTPFLYGAVIAYILAPICNRIEGVLVRLLKLKPERQGIAEALSIVLSLVLALALIWILVMLVFPQVWSSIISIANAIPGQLAAANEGLHNLLESQPQLQVYWDEFSSRLTTEVTGWLKTGLLPTVGTMVEQVGSQLAVFVGIVKNLFLGILISIYFLASRRQFAAQSRMLLHGVFPNRWADVIEEEILYADKMFNGFLMGKLVDSAIIGLLCFAGTTLMGIQSAVLVSVIVGVTNIIPFFGPFIGAIPSALLLLLENPLHCVYFIVYVVILQQLDGNVIGPKILGNSTGLSSFWVLFSILLFGGLWGIVGMIVGVPLFAVIYDIVRRLTYLGLNRNGRGQMIQEYNSAFHPAQPEKKKERSEKSGTGKRK